MTNEIVAAVLWFLLGSGGSMIIWLLFLAAGYVVSEASGSAAAAGVLVILGWVAASLWEAFVLIQVLIHAATAIQMMIHGN